MILNSFVRLLFPEKRECNCSFAKRRLKWDSFINLTIVRIIRQAMGSIRESTVEKNSSSCRLQLVGGIDGVSEPCPREATELP